MRALGSVEVAPPAGRDAAAGALSRLRRVVQHRGEGRHGLFLREGWAAFDGHVEGRPERPQVGRRPRGRAADEFGRHERRRPDDVAGAAGGMGGIATGGLGDAEIHQHRSPVLAEHHIRGLDVAVHDAGRVHCAQRGEQLQAQRGDRRRRQSTPASAQDGGQAGTLVVVHHQPVRAVVHHHVVHDGHMGMPDPGREPCLDPAVCVVDLLDGDVAVQQFVAGSPHPCRRPAADDLGQPVTAGQEQTGVGICGRRLLCRRRHDPSRPDRRLPAHVALPRCDTDHGQPRRVPDTEAGGPEPAGRVFPVTPAVRVVCHATTGTPFTAVRCRPGRVWACWQYGVAARSVR